MAQDKREHIGSEFLESILRDWTENLWTLNNQSRITDDASRKAVDSELEKKWYPNNDRGLTGPQRFSEQSFTLACYGMAYMDAVSRKATDALSNSSLVNAWRNSVIRNGFQQKYNVFEAVLKETLDTKGAGAAIAQFPKLNTVAPSEVIAALDYYKFKPTVLDPEAVKNLILKTPDPTAAPKPPPPPKP